MKEKVDWLLIVVNNLIFRKGKSARLVILVAECRI